ncbi:MAG TPA: cytochrome-c oxidase [Gammaproteobacteria bacterium]|nr:cytochrome-c oxidase [Gammaproteobacteria bacterium]
MATDIEARGARLARLWLKIAVTYLLVGATAGVFMGATEQFQFAPVHAHINLLGWVSMALAGLIYHFYPRAGGSKLGVAHFWMHNLVLPPSMVLLAVMLGGRPELEPVVGIFSVLLLLTLVVFATNIYMNVKPSN